MHVFVTGATGWVGSAVVEDLIAAGHRVTGLSRSATKAVALAAAGATVLHGTLDDLDKLREAAKAADAVIHTAFSHDFANIPASAAQDIRAIETLGAAMQGSDRPLLVTSGVALLAPGRIGVEADVPPSNPNWPRKSEEAARALAARGVRAASVRLAPSVHGAGDHGFIPILIALAREKGVSAYVGDGLNRWPGVYRQDAASLYRLALEQGATEPAYHAIGTEGTPFRDIAGVIGRRLGVPVESRDAAHFGWMGGFVGADMPASSAHSRAVLGWQPTGPELLRDIDQDAYYTS